MGIDRVKAGEGDLSWDELISALLEVFEDDSVSVEEVEDILARY